MPRTQRSILRVPTILSIPSPGSAARALPLFAVMLLTTAVTAAITTFSPPSAAHEWVSPPARRVAAPAMPPDGPLGAGDPWPGLLWRGPASGAPDSPGARDCKRAPERFQLDGPGAPSQQSPRSVLHGRTRAEAAAGAIASESVAKHAMPPTLSAPMAPLVAPPTPAPSAAMGHAADAAPAQPSLSRPASEPVTAGVVDDNLDFGEYQHFLRRHAGVPQRQLAIDQRVLLDVRDARGRPVPDASVSVWAGGTAQPLWARTDASGRAWLMPQADMQGERFDVHISKHGVATQVAWQRGQRDALQARLPLHAEADRAQLDIVFAIDATGSMADEIDKLKRSMRAVADQIAQLPSRPDLCFGLVAYRDRGDQFFVRGADLTNDLHAFQQVLGGLQASGGGDYPEAMNEALHTAIHRLRWRAEGTARIVILLADAPPHLDGGQQPSYDHDARGALARGIKVFGVGASGLDRQGEIVMRQMAQFTGGRFVFLTYSDAKNPASGPGRETTHDVRNYSVETLDKLLVRLVSEEMSRWPT